MSPIDPAGSARRKNGSVEAVWVSATYIGPAPSETMSHAAPTPCMNVRTSDTTSATSSSRKIGVRNGRHKLGASRFGDVAIEMSRKISRLRSTCDRPGPSPHEKKGSDTEG